MDHDALPDPAARHDLRRDLRGPQIFFIVASVIIGEGIFSGDASSLEVAGPGGTLIGLLIVGLLAICVMECVSELVQLFPVPNAIVEYIRVFVDEDLAWCCGIAYWYAWSSVFAALYLVAVNFAGYWGLQQTGQNVIFVAAPLGIFIINMLGVKWFGIVETIGGFLKICMVFGTGVAMYILWSQRPDQSTQTPFNDGVQADLGVVPSRGAAICWVIPSLAYTVLGVESVAVTAFEARDIRSLRRPSQLIAYVILALYLFTLISEMYVTSWVGDSLPAIYGNTNSSQVPTERWENTYNMAVVVAVAYGQPSLAGFLNGCYIFSVLSASNSALYVASRTLYGLARNTRENTAVGRFFGSFNKTVRKTAVPAMALLASMLSFIWLPFLNNLQDATARGLVLNILETTSSIMCIIVWAALCGAYIRFRQWVKLNVDDLQRFENGVYMCYDHNSEHSGSFTGLQFAQPGIAWVGLIGSLLVSVVLTTATWWNGATAAKFAISWVGPLVLIVLWGARKLWARYANPPGWRGWVVPTQDPAQLVAMLDELAWARPPDEPRQGPIWRRRWRRDAALPLPGGPRGSTLNGEAKTGIAVTTSPTGHGVEMHGAAPLPLQRPATAATGHSSSAAGRRAPHARGGRTPPDGDLSNSLGSPYTVQTLATDDDEHGGRHSREGGGAAGVGASGGDWNHPDIAVVDVDADMETSGLGVRDWQSGSGHQDRLGPGGNSWR